MTAPGKVYLVGAGPGDPRLITVRGKQCIERADVLVYDRLVSKRLLDLHKPGCQLVYVGKDPNGESFGQEQIQKLLLEFALAGNRVTRLKGGDPCVFGRGGEEAEWLSKHGIPFEVIPGVTSSIAVPAYAGIPITYRGIASSFSVIAGHEEAERTGSTNWKAHVESGSTLVFLMGVKNLERIVANLKTNGMSGSTPVAVIRSGTLAEQLTVAGTLDSILELVRQANLKNPAVIVVGDVVRIREHMEWREKLPLFGKRVLVTRARAAASEMVQRIEELGGETVEFPVIETRAPDDLSSLRESIRRIHTYDWVIFTSATGVESFWRELVSARLDVRQMRAKLLAVGPKTAEVLAGYGLQTEQVPSDFRAEGIMEKYQNDFLPGQKVLLPRGNLARADLPDFLEARGCLVDSAIAYETVPVNQEANEIVDMLRQRMIDIVTFTASSTIHQFMRAIGTESIPLLKGLLLACIGPITADTLAEYGLKPTIVAKSSTIEGLLKDILDHLK